MYRFITRWSSLFVLIALVGGLLVRVSNGKAAPALAPVSCSTMLEDYSDWAKQSPTSSVKYQVGFTLASNQPNNLVSYTEGSLDYSPGSSTIWYTIPRGLVGQGTQYFSDRRYGPGPQTFPFASTKVDALGVTIYPSSSTVTLQLLSWGGGMGPVSNLAVRCVTKGSCMASRIHHPAEPCMS